MTQETHSDVQDKIATLDKYAGRVAKIKGEVVTDLDQIEVGDRVARKAGAARQGVVEEVTENGTVRVRQPTGGFASYAHADRDWNDDAERFRLPGGDCHYQLVVLEKEYISTDEDDDQTPRERAEEYAAEVDAETTVMEKQTVDGFVYVSGRTQSDTERQAAEDAAAQYGGDFEVVTEGAFTEFGVVFESDADDSDDSDDSDEEEHRGTYDRMTYDAVVDGLEEGDRLEIEYESPYSGTVVEVEGTAEEVRATSVTVELDDGRTWGLFGSSIRSAEGNAKPKNGRTVGYIERMNVYGEPTGEDTTVGCLCCGCGYDGDEHDECPVCASGECQVCGDDDSEYVVEKRNVDDEVIKVIEADSEKDAEVMADAINMVGGVYGVVCERERTCDRDGCDDPARERSSYCSTECGDEDRGHTVAELVDPDADPYEDEDEDPEIMTDGGVVEGEGHDYEFPEDADPQELEYPDAETMENTTTATVGYDSPRAGTVKEVEIEVEHVEPTPTGNGCLWFTGNPLDRGADKWETDFTKVYGFRSDGASYEVGRVVYVDLATDEDDPEIMTDGGTITYAEDPDLFSAATDADSLEQVLTETTDIYRTEDGAPARVVYESVQGGEVEFEGCIMDTSDTTARIKIGDGKGNVRKVSGNTVESPAEDHYRRIGSLVRIDLARPEEVTESLEDAVDEQDSDDSDDDDDGDGEEFDWFESLGTNPDGRIRPPQERAEDYVDEVDTADYAGELETEEDDDGVYVSGIAEVGPPLEGVEELADAHGGEFTQLSEGGEYAPFEVVFPKPRDDPDAMPDGGERPRDVLIDAELGDRYTLTLSTGKEVTGQVDTLETTNFPGEPRERGLVLVDDRGEYAYDISIQLDRDAPPSISRTTFADVAAKLGRIDWDEVDDPDEFVTLDEGTVERVERRDLSPDGGFTIPEKGEEVTLVVDQRNVDSKARLSGTVQHVSEARTRVYDGPGDDSGHLEDGHHGYVGLDGRKFSFNTANRHVYEYHQDELDPDKAVDYVGELIAIEIDNGGDGQ